MKEADNSTLFLKPISEVVEVTTFNLGLKVITLFTLNRGMVGDWRGGWADPPENCHLNVKKLPKTWHCSKKIAKNFLFFFKLPMEIFFFLKKVFGNFLTVKWQFSGGSAQQVKYIGIVYSLHRLRLWVAPFLYGSPNAS